MSGVDAIRPLLSIVITAHNEGDEVARTIESIRANTSASYEILLVDDASTDGCCNDLVLDETLQVIRRPTRIGVANSRLQASRQARGQVIAYFDAHQRVEKDCLEKCAKAALENNTIVTPDILDFGGETRLHGAYAVICRQERYLGAEWKLRVPSSQLTRITALRAPTYVIPRKVYSLVEWSSQLRGWGGSEAAVFLKAFFSGVRIQHFCGPAVLHQFKPTFHYDVDWPEVWRNQAISTRICFDDRSWYEYWLPFVFEANLTNEARGELESDVIRSEQRDFSKHKVRCDESFWTSLVFQDMPAPLTTTRQSR